MITKDEQENIKKKYPSICYSCDNSRKTWSENLMKEGNVGCCIYATSSMGVEGILEAKQIAEGWVDLRSPIFGEKSGVTTNMQIITKEVKKCKWFTHDIWREKL